MTKKEQGEKEICSECGHSNWSKIDDPKKDAESTIHKCRKCGNTLDFKDKTKEYQLHNFYHDHPDKEPKTRSIVTDNEKEKR